MFDGLFPWVQNQGCHDDAEASLVEPQWMLSESGPGMHQSFPSTEGWEARRWYTFESRQLCTCFTSGVQLLGVNQALPFPGLLGGFPCLNSYSLHNIVHIQPTLPRVFKAHCACCLTRIVSFPRPSGCSREPWSLSFLNQLSLWRRFLLLPTLLCLAEFPYLGGPHLSFHP